MLSSLVDRTPLAAADAARLYEAAVADVLRAVAESGGDALVNYRDEGTLPEAFADGDHEAAVRELAAAALGDEALDEVRFERQVGSTRAARIGNTVTHLLEREGATTVGVLEPTAPLVGRTEVDGAAMSLRRNDVQLGPSQGGRTYFAGFAEPIDFEGAYAAPELATLARRGADAGLSVGFAPRVPTVSDPCGLRSTVAGIAARRTADKRYPEVTAAAIDDLGLSIGEDGTLERSETDNTF